MRDGLFKSLQRYTNMGLDWRKTVCQGKESDTFALTFADYPPIQRQVRQERSCDPVRYFNEGVTQWKQTLTQTLTSWIEVPIGLARELKATGDPDEELPNHEKWFEQMWSNVLVVIKAAPSTPLQGSIALEQPRTRTSPSSYQTPPTREELGSRNGAHSDNEACCSSEYDCLPFKAAFDGCSAACCNTDSSVCKFV